MGVRPGRALPSVIVGGLLATGVVLGTGTATAADERCTIGGVAYDLTGVTGVMPNDAGQCTDVAGAVLDVVPEGLKTVAAVEAQKAADAQAADDAQAAKDKAAAEAADKAAQKAAADKAAAAKAAADKAAAQKAAQDEANRRAAAQAATPAAAPVPAAAPAPGVAPLAAPAATSAAPAPLSGLGLGGGLSGFNALAPRAGSLPGFGGYDPGLLLAGGPTTVLAANPASSVTTASDVQALPVDGLPRGAGVPALTATGLLASVAALTLRGRMLARTRRRLAGPASTDSGDPTTPSV